MGFLLIEGAVCCFTGFATGGGLLQLLVMIDPFSKDNSTHFVVYSNHLGNFLFP